MEHNNSTQETIAIYDDDTDSCAVKFLTKIKFLRDYASPEVIKPRSLGAKV